MITIILSELNPSALTLEIVKSLTESNMDVTIVILGEISGVQRNAYSSLTQRYIELHLFDHPTYRNLAAILYKLNRQLRRNESRIVYASGRTASLLGMIAAFSANVPKRIFTRHHGAENHLFHKKKGVLIDRLTNFFATKVIAVSKVGKDTLVQDEFVRSDKVHVVYNALDFEEFSSSSRHFLLQQSNRNFHYEDSILIGVIGRNVPGKGIEIALSAFALFLQQFPNAKLRLIGGGDIYVLDKLRILESIPPANLELVQESPDIFQEYQALDLFLHLPEFRDFESFGLVYLEAIAAGVPSIFTLSGILNEISVPSFIRVVQWGSVEETYRAMLEFCLNVPTSYEIESKSITSNFDLQGMKDMYAKLIFE